MAKRDRNDEDQDEETTYELDAIIRSAEHKLRLGSKATTSRLLAHLETVLWEVARMEVAVREGDVVTEEDRKAFKKAFGRIQREGETLVSWLRFNPLEQPRN